MRERLIMLTCALAAGVLFLGLLLPGQGMRSVPRPTSEAQGGNGYRAARLWLQGEGITVRSLREPFVELARQGGLPPQGNLLIVTLPAAEPFSGEELRALSRWVAAGNTLLVMAALADAPEWAFAGGAGAAADVSLLTGLHVEPAASDAPQGPEVRRGTLVATRPDALFQGVGEALALSDQPAQVWRLKLPREGFVLALGRQQETGEEALWIGAEGQGRVIVSAFGSLFSDRALLASQSGGAGNARLLANLVGGTVAEQGAVLFDDFHQGLADLYDPGRFYHDPRLYQTLAVLALVWLLWLLAGSPRQLRALPQPAAPPGEAELVRAAGRMLARVLAPADAAQGLFAHFFRRVRVRLGVNEAEVWAALERHPGIERHDLALLAAWHAASRPGGARTARTGRPARIGLGRLHNLLQRIERQL